MRFSKVFWVFRPPGAITERPFSASVNYSNREQLSGDFRTPETGLDSPQVFQPRPAENHRKTTWVEVPKSTAQIDFWHYF